MSRRNSLESKAARREERKAPRKPGSLKPFHRIQSLIAKFVEVKKHFDALLAIRPGGILSRLFGAPERTPAQIVVLGDAQEAVVQAREALVAYKSRGHGKLQTRYPT